MAERQLNEQWIEEIDGKMHMLKAVEQTNKCSGCVFCTSYWCSDPIQSEREFDCTTMIIKGLGILNDDGLLPCPFCGEYPSINIDYNDQNKKCFEVVCINNGCQCSCETFYFSTLQQTIDAWNRRAQ